MVAVLWAAITSQSQKSIFRIHSSKIVVLRSAARSTGVPILSWHEWSSVAFCRLYVSLRSIVTIASFACLLSFKVLLET